MNHYIQVIDRSPTGVNDVFWREQDGKAWRIDVQSDEPLPIPLGLDPGTFLTQRHPGSIFYKLDLAPGQYHSRMARPSTTDPRDSPGSNPATDTKLLHSLTESSWRRLLLLRGSRIFARSSSRLLKIIMYLATKYEIYSFWLAQSAKHSGRPYWMRTARKAAIPVIMLT